jgi:site-specific recombinase XerC
MARESATEPGQDQFASHLVMRGVALKAVQELLGHATIDMTMRYAHLGPDVKRDAVHVLDTPSPARGTYGTHEA